MGFHLLRPFRFFAQALSGESTSKQMAMGFAIGLAVGLIPKGNLLAIAMMMVLCASRVNLGIGLLTAFATSWLGVFVDPVTHRLGLWLLSHETLVPYWTQLYDMPVVPWTAFNNTVVLGSFVMGLLLVYPVYRLSEPGFAKYSPIVAERLSRFRFMRFLWGAEWAGKLGSAS
jgi:uncharacterized protein (TIGR03546 family)